jgi:hypothetical protein
MGRTIEVTVTSVLQTTAGKMIFCRWPEANAAAQANGDGRRDGRGYRGELRRESDRREGGDRPAASEPPRPEGGSGPASPPSGNGPSARE